MTVGLDDTIVVAGEAGTIASFARDGRIQLHHTPHYAATPSATPRPAWWVDVFSRDTVDAERYQISRGDYEVLLASAATPSDSESDED